MTIKHIFISFTAFILLGTSFTFAADSPNGVVAKIGNTPLTEAQMNQELASQIYEAENNLYEMKKNWIEQKSKDLLFDQAAQQAGLSRKAWEAKEIDGHISAPTQEEIQKTIQQYGNNQPVTPEMTKQVTEYLKNQKRAARENEVYQALKAKTPVEIYLAEPVAPHIPVSFRPDDPSKGPADAPVTILEFTDFQCPFCKRSQDTLRQIETEYGNKIRLVARQYPLPFHNRARAASNAAMCAWEQGKFWPYRDKLFDKQQLEDADFTRYAKELHLKEAKFAQCVAEHRYQVRIDQDIADGQKFGVKGTPAFFVNGRPISGAQPLDVFEKAINMELAAKK